DSTSSTATLCSEGIMAEGQGRVEEARRLYEQAWEQRQDDYDACVAAHFLARAQERPEDNLRWNQESLDRANAVGDERVSAFYPSLYLNMGLAHETMGNATEAGRFYKLAARRVDDLPEGPYGDMLRGG